MHIIALLPILFLGLAIYGWYNLDEHDTVFSTFTGTLGLFFSLMFTLLAPITAQDTPVDYIAETTSREVIVYIKNPNDLIFRSERKVDMEEYMLKKEGFIRKSYNSWGFEIKPPTFFVK